MVENDMQRVIDDVARTLEHAYTKMFGQTRHETASSSTLDVDEVDVCSITIELLHLPRLQKSMREELIEAEDSYRLFPLEALISFETEDNAASATCCSSSAVSNGLFAYKDVVDGDDITVETSTTLDETETFDADSIHASMADEYYKIPSQVGTPGTSCDVVATPRSTLLLSTELIAGRWELIGKGDAIADMTPTLLKYANVCNTLRPLRLVHNLYPNIDDVQNLNSLFLLPFPLYVLHLVVETFDPINQDNHFGRVDD